MSLEGFYCKCSNNVKLRKIFKADSFHFSLELHGFTIITGFQDTGDLGQIESYVSSLLYFISKRTSNNNLKISRIISFKNRFSPWTTFIQPCSCWPGKSTFQTCRYLHIVHLTTGNDFATLLMYTLKVFKSSKSGFLPISFSPNSWKVLRSRWSHLSISVCLRILSVISVRTDRRSSSLLTKKNWQFLDETTQRLHKKSQYKPFVNTFDVNAHPLSFLARWFRPDTSAFDLLEIRRPYNSNYTSSSENVSWVTNTVHKKRNKQKPLNTGVCTVHQLLSF